MPGCTTIRAIDAERGDMTFSGRTSTPPTANSATTVYAPLRPS
jgi:hypothetical protein